MRGLVLEGGGAKGAFHCGAAKALYDYGYTFDGVAGTSIGAINGALIAQDNGYGAMYDMWTGIMPSDITDFDNDEVYRLYNREFSKDNTVYWMKKAFGVIKNRGIAPERTQAYLSRHIDENKIRASKMDFAVVTYCLSNRKPLELFKEDIPRGELLDYIFASAHYPAFRFDRIDGKYYFDGGIYNNLPLNVLCRKKGYDEIIAVRTMSRMPYKTPSDDSVKIDFICPSEDLGTAVNINSNSINNNIKLGYYDALRFIKKYNGNKYYIKDDLNLTARIYEAIGKSEIDEICEKAKMGKENFYGESESKIFDTDFSEKNNRKIFFGFLEKNARNYGVEKFKIYSERDFLTELTEKAIDSFDADNEFSDKTTVKQKKQQAVFKNILPEITEVLHE
jgi:NTE family protein